MPSHPPLMQLASSTTLAGRFRVTGPLGRGAHGIVVAALDLETGATVAIKAATPEGARALEAEARALAHLTRAGCPVTPRLIARFADLAGGPALIMERLASSPLEALLAPGRPLDDPALCSLAFALLGALDTLHRAGVVHGDLKPSHVFVAGDAVRFIDLGLARRVPVELATGEHAPHPADGVGSPAYLAPERLLGWPPDASSDLYAVGAMLFEAACGRPLVDADDVTAAIHAQLYEAPPWPPARGERTGPRADVRRVASRCLEKDPWRRPADAADALATLMPPHAEADAPRVSSRAGLARRR